MTRHVIDGSLYEESPVWQAVDEAFASLKDVDGELVQLNGFALRLIALYADHPNLPSPVQHVIEIHDAPMGGIADAIMMLDDETLPLRLRQTR